MAKRSGFKKGAFPVNKTNKHIPNAINVPLDSLRERLDELSREREVWVVCGVGQRAYNATRILQQNGFRVKNLSGGMQTYHSYLE